MKILVGLSGGVDSAVSALLLKQAGHEVHAGFMINYISEDENCTTKADLESAKSVANALDIPFFTFDYQEEYEKRIISFIYDGYERGITPNPDVLCNNLIKFDVFAEEAKRFGYDGIAMGHYAQVRFDASNQEYELLAGVDQNKDQSYFLSRLSQAQLQYAHFPIGGLQKSEVRAIAEAANLPNAKRKDSQGLCFIGKVGMKEFLGRRLEKRVGNIVDTSGRILGTHEGIHLFTIGQRKGIDIGGGPALFVIKKDRSTNTLVVGNENECLLYSNKCSASDWKSISKKYASIAMDEEFEAKIRYRQPGQKCRAYTNKGNLHAVFEENQRAVAPGQFLVLYKGAQVIGSGYINE